MVLVSHNIVSCMDGERPASLSPRVHEILREELGFTGVIVTDDLAMDGVRDFTDDGNAAVLAVQAGTICSAARILRPRSPQCWRRWKAGRSRRSG